MTRPEKFDFGDDSVAAAYDDALVPILFKPWAIRLIEAYRPWNGRRVLDLATGTGIVARLLADEVGSSGSVLGIDMNAEMLGRARRNCSDSKAPVEFVESPAESLDCPDASIDFLVCQQGFQFFRDKGAAVREIHRVLRPDTTAVVTVWRPVSECRFFGTICEALESVGEAEIADTLRVPFDFLPEAELFAHFDSPSFKRLKVERQEMDLVMRGGLSQAIRAVYSSPIAPRLRALPDDRQARFREALKKRITLSSDGTNMGPMVTKVLSAQRA